MPTDKLESLIRTQCRIQAVAQQARAPSVVVVVLLFFAIQFCIRIFQA